MTHQELVTICQQEPSRELYNLIAHLFPKIENQNLYEIYRCLNMNLRIPTNPELNSIRLLLLDGAWQRAKAQTNKPKGYKD